MWLNSDELLNFCRVKKLMWTIGFFMGYLRIMMNADLIESESTIRENITETSVFPKQSFFYS